MYEFLSGTCRCMRYCVALAGFLLAAAFTTYGVYMKETAAPGESGGLGQTLSIAFGAFVALQSCIIVSLHSLGDRMVTRLVASMEAELDKLAAANTTLQTHISGLEQVEKKLGTSTAELQKQLRQAQVRNDELQATAAKFSQLTNEYKQQLLLVKAAHEEARQEVDRLKSLADQGDERVKQLDQLTQEQKATIASMETQLANLSELQRKSVRMIQMLAVYGDECKTMGVALKDVAGELKKTDQSLGLTSAEMAAQLKALQAITHELTHVARERGGGHVPREFRDLECESDISSDNDPNLYRYLVDDVDAPDSTADYTSVESVADGPVFNAP